MYGIMPKKKSTLNAVLALKLEKGQRDLHCAFGVDLESDRVSRKESRYCIRKSGVEEECVRVVQNMHDSCRTVMRCAVTMTEEFKKEVR